MRIVAVIYLTITLVNCGLWLVNSPRLDLFASPVYPLMLGLYILGILALFAYVVGASLLPRRVWQCAFIVYVLYRLWELAHTGFILDGADAVVGLNTLSSYLWLVIPPGLAMWYLGFMSTAAPWRFGLGAPGLGSRL